MQSNTIAWDPKAMVGNEYFCPIQGAVLYAFYGQESDFRLLRDRNINMSGRVMLIRAGKISFAEKVGCRRRSLFKNSLRN